MADKLTFAERTARLAQTARQLQEFMALLQVAVDTVLDEVRSMQAAQERFEARKGERKTKAGA